MSARAIQGYVINVHALGATVRLEDGRIAAVPLVELEAHRVSLMRSLTARKQLPFVVDERVGRLAMLATGAIEEPVVPVPSAEPVELTDNAFEEQMANYLRETETWAPPDRPQPFERHLTRKRRRASHFPADAVAPGRDRGKV